MPRLRWLFLALLIVPLADALFLVFVAGELGWKVTVAIVVLTALLGTLFVRAEGRHTIRRIQRALATGESPADELIDGAFLIAAGAFLLTPGLLTDALGFLLVFPVTRIPFRYAVKRWVVVPKLDDRTGGFTTGNVWTFGFPGDDANPFGGDASGSDGGGFDPRNVDSTADGDDTVDLGEDSYQVEFDDDRDRQ